MGATCLACPPIITRSQETHFPWRKKKKKKREKKAIHPSSFFLASQVPTLSPWKIFLEQKHGKGGDHGRTLPPLTILCSKEPILLKEVLVQCELPWALFKMHICYKFIDCTCKVLYCVILIPHGTLRRERKNLISCSISWGQSVSPYFSAQKILVWS